MRRIAAASPGVLPPPRPGVTMMARAGTHRLSIVAGAARSRSRNAPSPLPSLPPRNQCHHRRRRRTAVVVAASPFFFSDQALPPPSSSASPPVDVIDVQVDPVGVKEDGTTPEHWEEALRSLDPTIDRGGRGADSDVASTSASTSSSSPSGGKRSNKRAHPLRSLRSLLPEQLSGGARLLKNAARARILRRFFARVKEINALEPEISALTDEELRLEAAALRARATGGGDGPGSDGKKRKPEPLDALLPRAFALVREASRRTLGQRPYDVQLVGAMVLHEGLVAEMRTGEGKTLVAVLAAFLNALTGRGVLVVTVNDYLAKRDREWVGKPLELLGLTTAVVTDAVPHDRRWRPLAADVCWLTAQQLAFTYLHDNTTSVLGPEGVALRRPLHFAIVDEVDSVLIDECRTPMIISGGALRGDEGKYEVAQQLFEGKRFTWELDEGLGRLVRKQPGGGGGGSGKKEAPPPPPSSSSFFRASTSERFAEAPSDPATGEARPGARGDYVFDRRRRTVTLTTQGAVRAARRLAEAGLVSEIRGGGQKKELFLPPPSDDVSLAALLWRGDDPWGPYLNAALRANVAFRRDVDYILRGGEAKIVDGETGRVLPQSRWTDGLHQAVEAKEGLRVRGASATLGQITFQTLFRKFERLCGMSGTAVSEAEEFHEVYNLGVIPVPPHRPPRRVDHRARVYLDRISKEARLAELVFAARRCGRPVLLGTRSVADSERLSRALAGGLAEARMALAEDYPWLAWTVIDSPDEICYDEGTGTRVFRPRGIEHRLLNARPERVAEEAAIVAQAGLPGAVTIATSMAGRGTDILLGGNARGLAAARLLRDLGWLLGGGAAEAARAAGGGEAGRAAARAKEEPMSTAAEAEAAEASAASAAAAASSSVMTLDSFGFPAFAAGVVERARASLYACEGCRLPAAPEEGWEGGAGELDDDFGDFGADDADETGDENGESGPQRARTERARAEVEAALLVAERIRAAYKLQLQQQQQQQAAAGSNVSGGDGGRAAASLADAGDRFERSGPAVRAFALASPAVAALDDPARRDLVVAAAVLWTWFDEVCSVLADQVRRAGGLLVVVASALDSERVLRQLVGRCGRQGDPGETFVVVDFADLVPEPEGGGGGGGGGGVGGAEDDGDVLFGLGAGRRAELLALRAAAAGRLGVLERYVPGAFADALFAHLRRLAGVGAGSARRSVKAYDEVMAVFRDHVYATRRGLLAGGARTQRALLRGILCGVAADLASAATLEGTLAPEDWDVEGLVREARRLEREGRKGLRGGSRNAAAPDMEVCGELPEGFVPGVSDPELYPPRAFAESVQAEADALGAPLRLWTPRARVFPGGGSDSSNSSSSGDIFEEHGDERARSSAASVRRAAEALRGAAAAAADEALRRGSGRGGGKSFLIDDATRAFLLGPGRSLRGFNALAGEFGGAVSGVEEAPKAAAASKDDQAATATTATASSTRDRNLVAARALALLSARELVRAASSAHPGLSYVLEAYFELRFGDAARETFSVPTPTTFGAEAARELLDEAWGDFLADARALEAAVLLRAFSAGLDPLEEFKLEAGELFVQLLRRYRRQVAAELLGGPEMVVEPRYRGEEDS